MSGFANQKFNDIAPAGPFRLGAVRSAQQLSNALRTRIVGQDHAVDAVVRALSIAGAQLADPSRPIATLLLAGPTGVGKTEIVRQVAEQIRGDPDNLCRIDMNSLAQEHYSASLSGAPPGYAGSKESYSLFQPERIEGNVSTPGIVLFDEVEKAHTTVLRSLLQITDTGVLRLAGGGREISFRNCLVFMTSNLGSREQAARQRSRPRRVARAVLGTLLDERLTARDRTTVANDVREYFDPELYNRFDEVILFSPLDVDSARIIVDNELNDLVTRLRARDIVWEPDSAVREHLLRLGFDHAFGARNVQRIIRRELLAPIAAVIVDHPSSVGSPLTIKTVIHGGKIAAGMLE